MSILFIADLHLHESRPQITRAFFQFLRDRQGTTQELYILGDFFDAWIGDDDDSELAQEVKKNLRQFSELGTTIFLMHGNRDFLLGESFARAVGAQLIAEGTIINCYGCSTLLLHGDSLCTGDKDYFAFRNQVRTPEWQAQVLAQPLAARRVLAAQLREKSEMSNSLKAEDIMDVTPEAVIQVMRSTGVKRLIHGHTHRPARHPLVIDGEIVERIVLGDWHEYGWCLAISKHSIELQNWCI